MASACADGGADTRADVFPHDGPAVGPADPVALRGTNDGSTDNAGAVPRAHDGYADAAPHAWPHARADDGRAFARADDGSADARPRGLPPRDPHG